ncbi:hypothetical protein CPC08DRAFT_663723, partial [Agrocybe pediades]
MVHTATSSCSSPDLKDYSELGTTGSGSYRIPRKPPPSVDIAARYPSPDPSDPFAPLWVLRNRTSSNLLRSSPPRLPHAGADDSQDNTSTERKYIVYPTPPSTTASNADADVNGRAVGGRRNSYSRTSPPASPSPTKGYKAKPLQNSKLGHYKTYSQLNDARGGLGSLNTVGTLQAFPRITPPCVVQSHPHIDLASPKPEECPRSPTSPTSREASASPQSRIDAPQFIDSSWSSDSEDDDEDDADEEDRELPVNTKSSAYNPRQYHKHSQSMPNPNARPGHLRSSPSTGDSSPKRLTKFLFPRKTSLSTHVNIGGGVVGPGAGIRDNFTSRGLTGRRSTTASTSLQYRHVAKSSISAPQPFALPKSAGSGMWDASDNIMPVRGRADACYKNGLGLDGSSMKEATNADVGDDMLYKGMMEKKRQEMITNSASGLSLSRAPEGVDDSPPSINELTVLPDSTKIEHDHHAQAFEDKENGKRCITTSHILPMSTSKRDDTNRKADYCQQAKKRPRFPLLRSLSVPLPSAFTENKLLQHNRRFGLANLRSRMSSGPQLLSPSSLEPSMHSISNTSIVNISISGPTFAPNLSVADGEELAKAFASPRRAPIPPLPQQSITEVLAADVKPKADPDDTECHTENVGSSCCSGSVHPPSRAESPPVPVKADVAFAPLRRPPSPVRTTAGPTPIISTSLPTEWELPTQAQIREAASLQITKEDGKRVTFSSLFENTRTVVVFIRHFWCPSCQDYMSSLKSIVKPEMLSAWPSGSGKDSEDLKKKLVSFVVIGNGSYGMIQKYKRMFALPFEVYTDPTMAIYKVLGMGKDGSDDYHMHHKSGGYVKHGLMGGIAMVVVRAIKVGMPVWEKGGDISQLGGEFIFGPGPTCSFAHRMQNTKGHAPIEDVLHAAGISPRRFSTLGVLVGMMSQEEEEKWMEHRQKSLDRMKEKKNIRR